MNLQKYSNDFPLLTYLVRNNSYPMHPQFSTFLSRLKTFDSYPTSSIKNKYLLSECGFTYMGDDDIVQCFSCGLILHNWEKTDEPWFEHSKWNPKCIFVLLCKGSQFIENVKNKCIDKSVVCDCATKSYDVVG